MKHLPIPESGLFIPALVLSASLHGALIGAGGWMNSAAQTSVIEAPNSLEVTVVSYPVAISAQDEAIAEKTSEDDPSEKMFVSDQKTGSALEVNNVALQNSRESLGALTAAQPIMRRNPAPPYPYIARQQGLEGTVRLEVLVGKNGAPDQVSVRQSSGHDVLDRSALNAVKQWQFIPARSGAMKFDSRIAIPIQFKLVKEE